MHRWILRSLVMISEICPGVWVQQVGNLLLCLILGLEIGSLWEYTLWMTDAFCGFFFFLTLIMFLRITFFSCRPAWVSVSCWVKRNQSWRQQRTLRLPGTQKVLQAAIWQRGTIQVQELERWLITEPPFPVWPCAIYYTAPLQAWFFSSVKWDQ